MHNDRTYFSNFCIDLTDRCNLQCRHCILDAKEPEKEIGWPVIERLIREAANLRDIKEIAFVGGEPFLEFDTLVKSVHLCKTSGLNSSVVTNGFWAFTKESSEKKLRELQGLTDLCVSTDIFHQEFVPVENIRIIIVSCNDLGIRCQVYFSYLNNPESEVENLKKQLEGLDNLYVLNQQPVIFIGRAAKELDKSSIYSYDPRGKPCTCIDSPLITSDGSIIACCGAAIVWSGNHLLQIGNIHNQTLAEIKKAAQLNPVLHAIRLGGPDKLVKLVRGQAEKEGIMFTQPPMDEIRDLCSLCRYIVMNEEYSGLLQRAVCDPVVSHRIAVDCILEFAEIPLLLEEGRVP